LQRDKANRRRVGKSFTFVILERVQFQVKEARGKEALRQKLPPLALLPLLQYLTHRLNKRLVELAFNQVCTFAEQQSSVT
jgi:hypothetical protein